MRLSKDGTPVRIAEGAAQNDAGDRPGDGSSARAARMQPSVQKNNRSL
jgi:hypothetical protein